MSFLERISPTIREYIITGRSEATVTIGRAAKLFGFSEHQLRDWEKKELLKPFRPGLSDAKSTAGQRQYSVSELDKLAIIRELINAGFALSSIPSNVDEIWRTISEYDEASTTSSEFMKGEQKQQLEARASKARDKDITNFTFLTSGPSFEFPSDFKIVPLASQEELELDKDLFGDGTLIVVHRSRNKVNDLNLNRNVLSVVRRLIRPIYEDKQNWRLYFGQGMHDQLLPGINFASRLPDVVLTGLADMVVRLGGKQKDGNDHWCYCSVLLPANPSVPLYQRSLVVRATSKAARHEVGTTTFSPEKHGTSLSLRAFQNGHVIYRPELTRGDTMLLSYELEEEIRSNIAVPIGGENGQPLGVLSVASYHIGAFSEEDQCLLRLMTRMMGELLTTYQAREQITNDLAGLIKDPRAVDLSFKDFLSENDFLSDIEGLLNSIKEHRAIREDKKN